MNISFLDLKPQTEKLKPQLLKAIESVIDETAFSGGRFVEAFENQFKEFCPAQYIMGVSNGTSALTLALLALGIKEGDEVLVPANTFIASAWAISHVGAKPVFVDCDPKTWNIYIDQIQDKINSKTKAIIGVHLYGLPCDLDSLLQICKKNHLFLIEDCAQAHGAQYGENFVGTFGHIGCFSFYPGKNLGALGEGGAVVTSSEEYAYKIRLLRNQGSEEKYYHKIVGYNERMDGIQAAVLSVKLNYLKNWNIRRREIAHKYNSELQFPELNSQFEPFGYTSVYHLFVIKTSFREKLEKFLNDHNIFPGRHYPVPCHLQQAYQYLGYKKGSMPNSEKLSENCLSLPIYPELLPEQVNQVIEKIQYFFKNI